MITATTPVPKRINKKKASSTSQPASPQGDSAETTGLSQLASVQQIQSIPLSEIKFHNKNRDLAGDESITELAHSIERLGQLEPATLRTIADKKFKYELLSGERRYRALRKLNRTHINAMVVVETSGEALVRLAAANSNRQDLNAVDRALLMEQLMQPIDKGGSGLSRSDAGKAVGLSSDSGCKNALRILKLPESIQNLIRTGKLSERVARRLVPFAELTEAMQEVAKDLEEGDRSELHYELTTCDTLPYSLRQIIEDCTRPMDDRLYSSSLDKQWQSNRKLFDGDAGLQVIELDIDKATWRLTTQTKEWDALQMPLVRELRMKGSNSKSASSKNSGKSSAKGATATATKPTAAQLAKELEAKRKAAAERLAKWTKETFLPCALRCQMAASIPTDYRLLMPFVQHVFHGPYESALDAAYLEAGIATDRVTSNVGRLQIPIAGSNEELLSRMLWRFMLWPVSGRIETKGNNDRMARRPYVVPIDCVPDLDRVVNDLHREIVRKLAARCSTTVQQFWDAAQINSPQRELLAVWFARHTTDQLKDLWAELKIKPSVTRLERQAEWASAILAHHTTANKLKLPLRLAWHH